MVNDYVTEKLRKYLSSITTEVVVSNALFSVKQMMNMLLNYGVLKYMLHCDPAMVHFITYAIGWVTVIRSQILIFQVRSFSELRKTSLCGASFLLPLLPNLLGFRPFGI